MSPDSSIEVARKVGISKSTLEAWLADGKIKPPKPIRIGQREFRFWTDADVKRIQKYKQENYRKGRGRKPKAKD